MTYDIRLLHRTSYKETWILYWKTDEERGVVGLYPSRDECVDAWARRAKLPVCSICRCVHGSEIQHECE